MGKKAVPSVVLARLLELRFSSCSSIDLYRLPEACLTEGLDYGEGSIRFAPRIFLVTPSIERDFETQLVLE